jgi:hypothetical protein
VLALITFQHEAQVPHGNGAGVQRALLRATAIDVSYVGNHGQRLILQGGKGST